jgi:8-oxo-dGTP pyrophosphatase MutT (NUDIX family)
MPQAAKISVGLHVFLVDREAGKVLLLKRANTGRYDGRWSVPAGRLDVGESFSQ